MLSKKYSILLSCLMVLLLIMAGCGSNSKEAGGEAREDVITLKFATWHSAESTTTKEYLKPFMEKVTSLTDGRVQFDFYPGEQLGKAADSVNLVASGVADISHFAPAYTPSETALGAVIPGIPGLFETTPQGAQAFFKMSQQSPALEEDYLNNGVRLVSSGLTPFYYIFNSKKEVKVPEDAKGLKLRGAGGVLTSIVEHLGATPVTMPSADLYTAYSSGVLDGVHVSATTVELYDLQEMTDYVTKIKLGTGVHGLVINEKVFQGLPKDIQEVIMQVGEEMGKSITQYDEEKDLKIYEEFVGSGQITEHKLSEDEKVRWQNFYDGFKKKILENKKSDNFDKALEIFLGEIEKVK
ncbi:TRAP transporter substrate-binding protein [Bacillus sp. OK048]|uniref:TRAP transporter substrate-binding protein n=1 Tax=Bacillus sp. OK048 TaxID=1882761 RepID=UPI0008807A57|nr:TRAP transporter substrate-binding protein DctP [Bacillus sp. OK048]SDL96246.1 TRAP-type C4-dicarboxylate transport system, substrate-binding protein [Bacillus sp. OK048]